MPEGPRFAIMYLQQTQDDEQYEVHLGSRKGSTAQAISVVEDIPWVVEVGTGHHGVLHMLLYAV